MPPTGCFNTWSKTGAALSGVDESHGSRQRLKGRSFSLNGNSSCSLSVLLLVLSLLPGLKAVRRRKAPATCSLHRGATSSNTCSIVMNSASSNCKPPKLFLPQSNSQRPLVSATRKLMNRISANLNHNRHTWIH